VVRSWRSLIWSKFGRDIYYTTPRVYIQSHESNVQTPTVCLQSSNCHCGIINCQKCPNTRQYNLWNTKKTHYSISHAYNFLYNCYILRRCYLAIFHHTPYSTHHTVQTMQDTPYSTHHTVYTIQYTPYSTHHTVHTIQYTQCRTHHTVHTIQYTPYSTHHTLHTIQRRDRIWIKEK
jgi:hypothetical protein